jgi:hypothetical protein
MEKITLRMLVLAAATITPQLAAAEAQPVPAKHAEQLSAEELYTAKRPEVYCVHDSERKESDS